MLFDVLNILANATDLFFRVLSFLILIRIFMSWLAPGAGGQAAYFIYSSTEPILRAFRRLPLRFGMLDLTPLVALIALQYIAALIHNVIISLLEKLV